MDLSLDATISYVESDRFYQNDRETRLNVQAEQHFVAGLDTLDLWKLPSGFRRVLAIEILAQMADIIACVDIPQLSGISDHEAMKAAGETNWRIPNSRIKIGLVKEGARAGEYLFSTLTIENLADYIYMSSGLHRLFPSIWRLSGPRSQVSMQLLK